MVEVCIAGLGHVDVGTQCFVAITGVKINQVVSPFDDLSRDDRRDSIAERPGKIPGVDAIKVLSVYRRNVDGPAEEGGDIRNMHHQHGSPQRVGVERRAEVL